MREMKDSGVAWIGEIPKSWNLERLQWHISEIKETNKPEKTKQILSLTNKRGVIPYEEKGAQGNVSKEDLSQYKLAYPDTIVANSMNVLIGSVGKCNYYGCVSPVYYVYKPNDGENLEFINYIFQTEQFQKELRRYANGILEIRLRVSSDGILKRKVAFPSTDEQQKIVVYLNQKLSQVDSLIANVQAQIEKLKTYKQSLITEVVTKGLDPNAPMKDSGVEWMGNIPKKWVVIPSKYLFANCDERRKENDVQLTASQKYGMISQQEYMRRENARVVLADKGLENWKHIEPFDFVISLRSFQGGLEMSEVSGCATWHYVVLRARQEIHPYYYKWLFKSSTYITALQRTCNYIRDGQDLRYSNFVKVPLCIPALVEQKQIADYLDAKCSQIDRLISLKESKIEKLQQYKRSLIYEYVTGKKEVV